MYKTAPSNRWCFFNPCWRWWASAPCHIRKGRGWVTFEYSRSTPNVFNQGISRFFLADSLQVNKSTKWNKDIRYLPGRNPLKSKPCWKYRLGQHTRILQMITISTYSHRFRISFIQFLFSSKNPFMAKNKRITYNSFVKWTPFLLDPKTSPPSKRGVGPLLKRATPKSINVGINDAGMDVSTVERTHQSNAILAKKSIQK